MKKRKILSLVLALVLLLGMTAIPAEAAGEYQMSPEAKEVYDWYESTYSWNVCVKTDTGTINVYSNDTPDEMFLYPDGTLEVWQHPDGEYAATCTVDIYHPDGTKETVTRDNPDAVDLDTPLEGNTVAPGTQGNVRENPSTYATRSKPVSFTDVPADAWYAEAVNALAAGGLVQGDGNGHFNPDGQVTYAEFVTILTRLYNMDPYFDDPVPKGSLGMYLTALSAYGERAVSVRHLDKTMEDAQNGDGGAPVHWAGMRAWWMGTTVMNVVEIEDLDVPVIRGSAIANIAYAAINASDGEPAYVNNYTLTDIPDWKDVLGITHKVAYEPTEFEHYDIGMDSYSKTVHVWPIDDELHFLPDGYVFRPWNSDYRGYSEGSVAANDLDGQTYVFAHPDLILRAYNMGLTNGVDDTHACDVYGRLTRAELAVLLYRAGLTRQGLCKIPEVSGTYEGLKLDAHDAKYWG